MSDAPLYARLNRRQTHVVCGVVACGTPIAEIRTADRPFRAHLSEVGGLPADSEYLEVHAGERYVWLLPGFMAGHDNDVFTSSPVRRAYQRKRGLPVRSRFDHGVEGNGVLLPVRLRCVGCWREQILDAGRLGVLQRLVIAQRD